MLPNSLSIQLKKIAQELEIKNINELAKFFEYFYKNPTRTKYIFIGALMRKSKINQEQAYTLMNSLVKEGFIERVYQFRCPHDGTSTYLEKSYMDLPTIITCEECFEDFILRDHLYIVYKVKK